MRAFIFSLDAFIAFTLALVAIYSLIFFSSIPSSYYYLLTQAHFLSKDALYSVSTVECDSTYLNCGNPPKGKNYTVLERVLFHESMGGQSKSFEETLIKQTIGKSIPEQFGYNFEKSEDNGITWTSVYNSNAEKTSRRPQTMRKLQVASQVVAFDYEKGLEKQSNSVYHYSSCKGSNGLIVCGKQTVPADLVPKIKIVLVRLSVYI